VRWIDILGFRFQFSELLKPFLAVILAGFLTKKPATLKRFGLVFLLLLPMAFLIFRQPDLGNALIYSGVVLITVFMYGFSFWYFLVGGAVILILSPIAWRFFHAYQRQRILTFLHFTNDPLGTSYNLVQSIIAVGSGMFFGKGLGQGTQSGLRFLPERHTDFIFATLSEDLGFFGGLLIILAFGFLFYRIYAIYTETEDAFLKTFLIAAFALLLIQFFVNIGMNIGIMPIVGVTLPFVSYGGSSLVANAILLGMISSVARNAKKKHLLEIG
ncbi:MAG: FtsW/RodA/SpoVE family cell cycle protein, partial [Candidatus Levyibacteriota bacterium]